jgi:hypothetical protein
MFGKHLSAETRAKISVALKGPKNPMFGKTGPKHHLFGKTPSAQTRAKISAANKGKTRSTETRANMSAARGNYYVRLRNSMLADLRERGRIPVWQSVRGEDRGERVLSERPAERVPAERLHELVSRLPEKERALVQTRFGFEGPEMALPEAAKPLGLKPDEAERVYNSALKRLRRWLEE